MFISSKYCHYTILLQICSSIFLSGFFWCCCTQAAAASLDKRYTDAEIRLQALQKDPQRKRFRSHWDDLIKEFLAIYEKKRQPSALFRAAQAWDGLASNSFSPRDYRAAVSCYEQLAKKHIGHKLADDALYRAACIRATNLKDNAGALRLIRQMRQTCPKGDMLPKAAALERLLQQQNASQQKAAPSQKTTAPPRTKTPAPSARHPAGGAALSPRVSPAAFTLEDGSPFLQTIFIDAGHGGHDPGTVHNSIIERELTLDIARRLGRILSQSGCKIWYSRTANTAVPLVLRSRMANRRNADLFISIHVNAHPSPHAAGIETYFPATHSNKRALQVAQRENAAAGRKGCTVQRISSPARLQRIHNSNRLARFIQRNTLDLIGEQGFSVRDGGVKSAPFCVLMGATMPSVLIEVGYCTNAAEARNLRSAAYREALASGIARGLQAYRKRQHRMFMARNPEPARPGIAQLSRNKAAAKPL